MDQGLLLSNMDLQDNIYLYCISCDYKNFIGTSFYDKLVLLMNGINNG
jgi:hypothetical protein